MRCKLTNSLLSSCSYAHTMIALLCCFPDKVNHVYFIGVIVNSWCHDYDRFLILGRLSSTFTIFCVCPVKSYGSTVFVNKLFSNILRHVVFLVSVHVLLKDIQYKYLKRRPCAQVIEFDFKIL